MDRRQFLLHTTAGALLAPSFARASALATPASITVDVDPMREAGPFLHTWESCVGSDRLAVAFREQWLKDLAVARDECGFRAVRCHGLFDDEMGICPEVDTTGPVTSFVYLDQVYDRLLELGVRPFVELSFMPTALASSRNAIFWYRGNTSPPRDMRQWTQLLDAFARHLVTRYGIGEVATWRFEVWNEPNLSFWAGTRAQYFDFYRQTALALKAVDRRIQVGGPATAMTMWVPEFLDYCASHAAPVDFVSTHSYADDPPEDVFDAPNSYPFEEMVPRALRQAMARIRASAYPDLPLVVSEWSSQNPAFIAQTIHDCDGIAETMSYWTFNSIFEEQGTPRTFFNNAYGLLGPAGIPRPAFHAFALLHRLGEARLRSSGAPVIATRRPDGTLAILAWNLIPRTARGFAGDPLAALQAELLAGGPARRIDLRITGREAGRARVTIVDPIAHSHEPAYAAMGRPAYPSREQIEVLRRSTALPATQEVDLTAGRLTLEIPANSVALVEL